MPFSASKKTLYFVDTSMQRQRENIGATKVATDIDSLPSMV